MRLQQTAFAAPQTAKPLSLHSSEAGPEWLSLSANPLYTYLF